MQTARVLLAALTLAAAWALLVIAFGGSLHAPDVPSDRARAVALQRVEGTVLGEHYGRESGRWAYTFDIRPQSDAGRVVFVTVDADHGTVLAIRSGREVAHNAE